MSKKGIAKVVATGLFVGGIAFAGINYTGGDAVDNITTKMNELQDRFELVKSDNTYLQGEYNELNGLYVNDMVQADEEISKLISTAIGFREQLRTLQDEKANANTDNTASQDEIQAEITRLEADLTQANNDIADLEAHIATIEAETQYDPINKEAYSAEDLGMTFEYDFISLDAFELDYDLAVHYADNANAFMDAFRKVDPTYDYFTILGVDVVYSDGVGKIAYVIDDATYSKLNDRIRNQGGKLHNSNVLIKPKNVITSEDLYLVNNNSGKAVYMDTQVIIKQVY